MKIKDLSVNETEELFAVLKARFEKNSSRHKGIDWEKVQLKLEKNKSAVRTLSEMEKTGGEPDVIGYDKKADKYIFCDCSEESPKGRRSLCYDKEAHESRKENKPKGTAIDSAVEMGAGLLTEEEYLGLQKLGKFDLKTSSWLKTPDEIRNLGGAIYGDRRFDRVFIYHNGAESYYAARGFRALIKV